MDLSRFKSALVALVVALTLGLIAPYLLENLDAREIMVIQSPLDGTLSVFTDPGVKWQGFGKVTKYPRRQQYSFSSRVDQGSLTDQSIRTRFNDGGHANISGVVSWEMPLAVEQVVRLHKDFGSFEAIEQQLIRPMIEKVIYNVGPTMSSTESSAERRPEIPQYVDDQLQNGPYLTHTVSVMQKDPVTGLDKQVNVVQIVLDKAGLPVRSAKSQIKEYGIALFPVTINEIKYDSIVEEQIAERQKATTQVQIALANAKKAEQDAITIAKQGEAMAAKAKWEQETLNAKEIAEAEKDKLVAQLRAEKAELIKREQILLGEGEAARRRLVMEADGALDQKLNAYTQTQRLWAEAFANYKGTMVPGVVMGATTGTNSVSSAQQFMELLAMKAARDLSLDLGVGGQTSAPAP